MFSHWVRICGEHWKGALLGWYWNSFPCFRLQLWKVFTTGTAMFTQISFWKEVHRACQCNFFWYTFMKVAGSNWLELDQIDSCEKNPDIDCELDQLFITYRAFSVGVSMVVGVLSSILTKLTVFLSCLCLSRWLFQFKERTTCFLEYTSLRFCKPRIDVTCLPWSSRDGSG